VTAGTPVAADVPGVFDVIINGAGYMFEESLEPSVPFRIHKANYGYTPTFIERSNTSGNFGDNQQDFFLTVSQNNWDLGSDQRYYRASEPDRTRRFWSGLAVNPVSVPGQVTLRNGMSSTVNAAAVQACTAMGQLIYMVSSTNLYSLAANGTIADLGAHGVGVAPGKWGVGTDGQNIYVSSTAGGTVGIRKWNGASWSTFSANGCDSIAFLNNALYGFRDGNGDLVTYSTAGAVTSLFTWKDAAGSALTGGSVATRIKPYGGKLAIMRTGLYRNGELWQYDGTGTSQLGDFPANFTATEMEVTQGIIFVGGYVSRNADVQPAIYYYVNGTMNLLWQSKATGYTNLYGPSIAAWDDGIAFTDDSTTIAGGSLLMEYKITTGGVHSIGSYSVTNAQPMMAATNSILVHTRNATTLYFYPTTTAISAGIVNSSLFDFETSLTKMFRGVRIDFDKPTGSTVDISYQVDSVDGSYTSLQTNAASGTEYTLTSVNGRSISVQVTLNKGSSTYGPVLKRVSVRAAPLLTTFRRGQYILNLAGRDGKGHAQLRDETSHPLDGYAQAQGLVAAAIATAPFSITDRFGTYTGLLEPDKLEIREIATEEYVAIVFARSV
jgi:hypothetical protein